MARRAYVLAGMVFLLDQLTKWWIIHVVELQARGSIPLLPVLSLTWVENRGVSMGLFTAGSDVARWALVVVTAAIAVGVAWWIRREAHWIEQAALGLILGGALGNIVDRIRFGYVVDFVHLHAGRWSFYVFNVADAAITIGVAVLLLRALFGSSETNGAPRQSGP
jgi:signal peptidase II